MRDLATQRAARSEKTSFVVGFLSGYEVALLPELLGVLRDDLCDAELTLVSSPSPELTRDLISGKVDLAFIRPYDPPPELALKLLEKEPLVVIMLRDHPMADRPTIRLEDISSEALISIISISRPDAPALPRSIDEFVARSGVTLAAGLEARRPGGPEARRPGGRSASTFTLVLSAPGVCILAGFVQRLLLPSFVGIHVRGDGRRLAVPCSRHRPVQSPGGWVVDTAAHESGHGYGCVAYGVVPAPSRSRCGSAQRPRQSGRIQPVVATPLVEEVLPWFKVQNGCIS
jgi:LysR family hca operon transcriptional activator